MRGILFHRVINNFMIQSGDPDSKERIPEKLYGNGGPAQNLPAEIKPHLFHKEEYLHQLAREIQIIQKENHLLLSSIL